MARSTKTASSPRFPLRRSLRLITKHSFRFSDLPGELRNKIYILALRHNDKDTARTPTGALELTAGPTPTARALSAVSKRVRTESKTAFYAANTFAFTLAHSRKERSLSASKLAKWAATPHLGELVTPFLRGLVVGCSSKPCPRHVIIDLRHPTKPVTYLPGYGCCISYSIREADMNAWVLAVLRPGGGELKLEAKRLQAMLEGLKVSARGFAGKSAETKAREVEMLVK